MIPVQDRAVADYKGRYPDSRLKTSLKNGLRCFLQSTGPAVIGYQPVTEAWRVTGVELYKLEWKSGDF